MNNNLYKEAQGYADESGRTVNVRIYTPNGHVDRDQDFNPKLSEDDKRLQKIDEKIEKLKEERAGMDNSVGSRALKEHREKISGKPTGDKNV